MGRETSASICFSSRREEISWRVSTSWHIPPYGSTYMARHLFHEAAMSLRNWSSGDFPVRMQISQSSRADIFSGMMDWYGMSIPPAPVLLLVFSNVCQRSHHSQWLVVFCSFHNFPFCPYPDVLPFPVLYTVLIQIITIFPF